MLFLNPLEGKVSYYFTLMSRHDLTAKLWYRLMYKPRILFHIFEQRREISQNWTLHVSSISDLGEMAVIGGHDFGQKFTLMWKRKPTTHSPALYAPKQSKTPWIPPTSHLVLFSLTLVFYLFSAFVEGHLLRNMWEERKKADACSRANTGSSGVDISGQD